MYTIYFFREVYSQKQAEKFYISSLGPKGFWYGLKFMDEDQIGSFGPSVERCFFVMMQIMLRNKLTKLHFNCKENKSKQQLKTVD